VQIMPEADPPLAGLQVCLGRAEALRYIKMEAKLSTSPWPYGS
jgi:hypothetical protein